VMTTLRCQRRVLLDRLLDLCEPRARRRVAASS
jgi:hypothetical protein